jgi:formamidopyrimidine-DNA glycosylase
MPELPEVENFRRLLLPLVSGQHPLRLERQSLEKSPPSKFVTDDEINEVHRLDLFVSDVLRKGKLICLVLKGKKGKCNNNNNSNNNNTNGNNKNKNNNIAATKYMFLHMGMTGRISTPDHIPKLKELKDTDIYPPPYTYIRLVAGPNEASFSDPRKFGSMYLKDTLEDDFDILAPDALNELLMKNKEGKQQDEPAVALQDGTTKDAIIAKLIQQSMGIKGILLDQKRCVCGVGNWVADEVLYQTNMHPDQNFLSEEQALLVLHRLHIILEQAVQCLSQDEEFPQEWLFHYRWSKRGSAKKTVTDAKGRSIIFVTSGGRTSAVVPSIQKKINQKPVKISCSKQQNSDEVKKKKARTTKTKTMPSIPIKGGDDVNEVPKPPISMERKRKHTTSTDDVVVKNNLQTRRSPRLSQS